MCAQLAQLEEAMAAFASSFDPAVISAAQAEGVMERAARIEHMAATVKALAAARMAATELWSLDGDRSPAHMLARRTGSNVSAAAQALEMATKLAHHAKTEAAARRGELSLAQASAVADAAEADPACEEELLALASRASLQELREESGRRVAAASDATEAHARIHAQRAVRSWTGTDGVWRLAANGTPEAGAQFMARLEADADAVFSKARVQGRTEPTEAYRFDALMAMGTEHQTKVRSSGRTKVLIRVDVEALLRGHPIEGEVCEVAGYAPVPVSVVEDVLSRGDTFWAAVITKGKAVTGVAHLGRHPTAHQRSALEWLYPTCAAEGCSALVRQIDHRVDWAKSHITLLDELDGLCKHDHWLKTHEGWALVEGVGKRAFVSPTDPRHPKNTNAAEHERPPPRAA